MFIRDFAEELKLHDIEIDEEELGKEQIDLCTIVSKNALKYALKGKSDVLGKCRIPMERVEALSKYRSSALFLFPFSTTIS